ncbi:MAG: GspE/PulE family protein [Phycisphaerales bacterium]|nr:type II/IV secretion system protein [Planctomycetota bacterium]MCH8508267.1 GspE/PulE family protein [Phycisphaerales bacterium]
MLDTSEFVIQALIEDGKLSAQSAEDLRRYANEHAVTLEEAVIRLQKVSTRDLAIAKAIICEYPFVDLTLADTDIRNSRRLPKAMAERLVAFPIYVLGDIATVAMEDPLDLQAMDLLQQTLRRQIDPVVCDSELLRTLIVRAYTLDSGNTQAEADDGDERVEASDEPVVAAVNQILYTAAEAGASDIHINPDERLLHLRYRIDGVLQPQQGPAITMHEGLVQRLKVMAQLDVTQTRRPQDGKFRFRYKSTHIDVRLSIVPTIHGENAVLRLLRPGAAVNSVEQLGMPADIAHDFAEIIRKPHGLILTTGPTGSGKTTTLYTAIGRINSPERNILTVEDPVEIRMPMIRQIQVNPAIGMTFASALRSLLRQDPDVLLIGEIRDEETAKIAAQAALTGHLVFSTLHTNDAVGAVARLREFGVPNFAINNALLGVIAQRLVRKVCEHCRKTDDPDPDPVQLRSLGIAPDEKGFIRGTGCPNCMNTGYRGRIGVYEMLRATDGVRDLIERGASTSEIAALARAEGTRSMLEDGVDKARLGITSIDELNKLHATIEITERQAASPRAAA